MKGFVDPHAFHAGGAQPAGGSVEVEAAAGEGRETAAAGAAAAAAT